LARILCPFSCQAFASLFCRADCPLRARICLRLQLQHHNPSLTACKCCLPRNSFKIFETGLTRNPCFLRHNEQVFCRLLVKPAFYARRPNSDQGPPTIRKYVEPLLYDTRGASSVLSRIFHPCRPSTAVNVWELTNWFRRQQVEVYQKSQQAGAGLPYFDSTALLHIPSTNQKWHTCKSAGL
jgi:hypothetical protein